VDKRLQKRHKRQVLRAREHVKLSEPDLRTPEQVKAAREASQPAGGWRHGPNAPYVTPPGRKPAEAAADSTPKVDA
jgi:hypothetical protein